MPDEGGLLMDTEEEIESSAEVKTGSRRRTWIAISGALLGLTAVLAISFGEQEQELQPIDEPDLNEVQGLSMFGGPSYVASQTCYAFTGGTCKMNDCDKNRGASCQSGKCVCEAGCSGADNACHTGENNQEVFEGVTLKNAYWTKYSMYFQGTTALGQMKTTNAYEWMNLGKDKFRLLKLPGKNPKFLLGSVAYPDSVARIASTAMTSVNSRGLYSTGLGKGKSPKTLAVSVCFNAQKKSLMFGSEDESYWAYLRRGSWYVYASSSKKNKVGDGGLWTPTPELTQDQIGMLPSC